MRDEEIWTRMLLWTAERTGLCTRDIEAVFEVSEDYWQNHLRLAGLFMTPDPEDP